MTALLWFSWLAGIDWLTIFAFLVVEVAVVLVVAPFVIQRRNEARAVEVFTTKLLPLMPKPPVVPSVADIAAAVRAELPTPPVVPTITELAAAVRVELQAVIPAAPSVEDQDHARAQLAAAMAEHVQAVVPAAVQAAVDSAVKGRMGALSAAGVEAKQGAQAMEWAFRQAVARKGGWKASLAIVGLKMAEPKLIKEGAELFALSPDGFDAWWDEHGIKFLGGDAKPKPKNTAATNGVVRL